jgi:hypothetical protein
LLTCGFKTVPKYNFFELLKFAVEKFTDETFAEFLAGSPELKADYQACLNSQKNPVITINETILDKFVSSQTSHQKEIFKQLNLQDLINQQIRQEIAGLSFKPTESYEPVAN